MATGSEASTGTKLHGRAFYESLGSPKVVLAPMVDQSEFAWRLLSRSFLMSSTPSQANYGRGLLAYTPMFHAKLFAEASKYRQSHFESAKGIASREHHTPYSEKRMTYDETSIKSTGAPFEGSSCLDGNPAMDRPLFVQFCANDPEALLNAARQVENFCDAVDLNLGCPQGIAKRGHYGAFLQEDWPLIHTLISTLHRNLSIPVTAKMRILESKERTLDYARMLLDAGASIITVHGRRREQKGHITGLADWTVIRYLRDSLPPETVIFANGNILRHEDIEECLSVTGADAVMSAEGNLCDPSIFATPPAPGKESREYWRGHDGRGGYRMDAVLRRYLDIIWRHIMHQEPPKRRPLFVLGDHDDTQGTEVNHEGHHFVPQSTTHTVDISQDEPRADESPAKKQKMSQKTKQQYKPSSPSLLAMQAHLFNLLRPLVSKHHYIRDALARARAGSIWSYEEILTMVEYVTKKALLEYAQTKDDTCESTKSESGGLPRDQSSNGAESFESSSATVERCKRPWWICQPYVRPLPAEALAKGSIQLSKKARKRLREEEISSEQVRNAPQGTVKEESKDRDQQATNKLNAEIPREGLICG